MTIYAKDSHPINIKGTKTMNELVKETEEGESCVEFTHCIPFSVGPCDFDVIDIPSYEICKGECINIDISLLCDLAADMCVHWAYPTPSEIENNIEISVCPKKNTEYPFSISNKNGHIIMTGAVPVKVNSVSYTHLTLPTILLV